MIGRKAAALLAGLVVMDTAWARSSAADRWAIEIHLGGAWSVPMPLEIQQTGFEDLDFNAQWKTEALSLPLYYVARLVTSGDGRGWALDLTHHKVHLANPPGEVGSFSVSHGYNLLTLQRLVGNDGRRYGLGAGVVIAHPESEVRGQRLDEHEGMFGAGYYLAGPTVGAMASWLPTSRDGFYPSAEVRVTASYARVPVAGGHARVPNVALHVTVGIGWEGAR